MLIDIRTMSLFDVITHVLKELDVAQQSAGNLDLLEGASQISQFIYGDVKQRRRVYHLASTKSIPTFNLGGILCARKSTLLAWIEKQERGES